MISAGGWAALYSAYIRYSYFLFQYIYHCIKVNKNPLFLSQVERALASW